MLGGLAAARIECDPGLVPAPGRYVLAHEEGSQAPLATELFATEHFSDGFMSGPPIRSEWHPGSILNMRGPLGVGFELPKRARRVALIAYDDDPSRLLPLALIATQQGAAVALVCKNGGMELPPNIEIHPQSAMLEVCEWSDYAALDASRESLPDLVETLGSNERQFGGGRGQALIRAPMPCGGLAECGVCAVRTRRGPLLACEDGPVFDLDLLIPKS